MKASTLKDALRFAKANPDKLTYSSLGPATNQAISMAHFNSLAGISMTHVPYSSAANMYPDIVSGRVDLTLDTIPNALPLLQKGAIKAFAVTSSERISTLPDVPTVSEAGVPNYQAIAWFGIVGPAGIPAPTLQKLATSIDESLKGEEYAHWIKQNSALPEPDGTPESFDRFIRTERDLWKGPISAGQKTQ